MKWLLLVLAVGAIAGVAVWIVRTDPNQPRYDLRTVTTSDGHTLTCLEYHEGGGQTSVGSLTCDFTTLRSAP